MFRYGTPCKEKINFTNLSFSLLHSSNRSRSRSQSHSLMVSTVYCLQAVFIFCIVHCFSCFHAIIFQSKNTQAHLGTSQSAHPHQPFTTMNWAKFSFRYSESELNFQFEQNHHIWRWKATVESQWNHIKIRANNQHIYTWNMLTFGRFVFFFLLA